MPGMSSELKPRLGDRALFPDLSSVAYLNHAGVSPVSLPVRRAVEADLDLMARQGGGAILAQVAMHDRLRRKLGRLIGATPEDLALVPNTSTGIIDVALCVPWQKGDRILLFEGEFPANVTPWQQAARLFELEVGFMSLRDFERGGQDAGLEELERRLERGVKLVAVSAVQFQTGLRMPLEAMARSCAQHGTQLFVDAVQACGVVPLDAGSLGVDYLSCGGHKWLMGLQGAGFLYVRPDRAAALRPYTAGWLSHENALTFLSQGPGRLRYDRPIRRRADLFEVGTSGWTAQAALEAALDLILELSVPAVQGHVGAYLDALQPQLAERGFDCLRSADPQRQSGILATHPPPGVDVVALRNGLAALGVVTAIPDGNLRFAPHWPNSLDEIPKLLAVVDAALR